MMADETTEGTPSGAGESEIPVTPEEPLVPAAGESREKPPAAGEQAAGEASPAPAARETAQPEPAAGAGAAPVPAAESPAWAGFTTAVRRTLTSKRAPRLRTAIAAFLVVAALLGVLASAVALWAHAVVFDTDTYVRIVTPVAEDPEVRAGVAAFVASRAVEAADLEDRLADALPSEAALAAPALTQALRQFLTDEVEEFLATDAAQRLWVDLNRIAHEQLLLALEDESRFVTVGREDVRLDLIPLVAVALQRLEDRIPDLLGKDVTLPRIDPQTAPADVRTLLQDALGRRLPADFGSITLLNGDAGYQAKRALRLFEDLLVVVLVLTAVLVAAALLVSVRRLRTALWLGLGALVAFAAARVLEAQLERAAAGAVKSQGGAAVARSVVTSAVSSLNGFLVWVAVAGVVVAVAAILALKRPWLDAVGAAVAELFGASSDLTTPDTRAGRWLAEHLDTLRVGGVVVAVVALLLVTGSVAGVVVVVLALVVYELALTAFGAGVPRESAGPDAAGRADDDGEEPAV
jgi:hypothetical protein